MGNLKEIRQRIGSVKSTQQITKAMKMVAASKLRRAQTSIVKIRPYADKIDGFLAELAEGMEDLNQNPYFHERPVENVLIIPITGDTGLCGAFNSYVISNAIALFEENKNHKTDSICIGKKGGKTLQKRGYNVLDIHTELSKNIGFEDIKDLAKDVLMKFVNKEYDKVYIVYNEFKNPAVYKTKVQQFLPVSVDEFFDDKKGEAGGNKNFLFEPSENEIVEELIPKSLLISFYRMVLESNASEHGSRMTAMDKATDNANELLKDLKLTYNKARQAAITNEILEIVGGSDALAG